MGTQTGGQAPLKVQFVSTHYAPEHTGNAPYVAGAARGLAARGLRVSVLAGAPHYPGWKVYPASEWAPTERSPGLVVRRLRAFVPAHPSFFSRVLYELAHGLRFARHLDVEADVVVLVTPALFGSVVARLRLAFRRRGPKVVVWMQDLYSAGIAETPGIISKTVRGLITALEGALARSADSVIVIHQRFRAFVTDTLGADPTRTLVIRNWTHLQAPDPARVRRARVRAGWTRPGETVVLHAGNMGEKQGLEHVVAAARWAEANNRPVRFVLLGDGNQRRALEALGAGCANLEFRDPVTQEEFPHLLAAADVLLVNERPSLQEAAVPSKLTSYFATGRPVLVASNAGSITSQEIRLSGAGRVTSPSDPAALVQAAERIQAEWTEKDELAGPEFVASALSEAAAITAFTTLLHSLADLTFTPCAAGAATEEGKSVAA